jgi:hypothetical protein
MPVWQLLDDGIQGNDLVLKDKQKCQQVALNLHCAGKGKGKERKGREEAVADKRKAKTLEISQQIASTCWKCWCM